MKNRVNNNFLKIDMIEDRIGEPLNNNLPYMLMNHWIRFRLSLNFLNGFFDTQQQIVAKPCPLLFVPIACNS